MMVCCCSVPATIIDELSSDDTTVQEGDVVVLVCNVTGVPRPDVTWYRRPAVAADKMAERESKMCPLRSKGQGTLQSPTSTAVCTLALGMVTQTESMALALPSEALALALSPIFLALHSVLMSRALTLALYITCTLDTITV